MNRTEAASALRKRRLVDRNIVLPAELSVDAYGTINELLPALVQHSLKYRPAGVAKVMHQLERMFATTLCTRRAPTPVRSDNMFERCGIALLLRSRLLSSLEAAELDGTLTSFHFTKDMCYIGGQRASKELAVNISATRLVRAVEDVVREHLDSEFIPEICRLALGIWPYFGPERYGATYLFDAIMNYICSYANNGTLLQRVMRSVISTVRATDALSAVPIAAESATPLSTFQCLGRFADSTDLYVVGIGEGRQPWGAHGNSARYGVFTSTAGEGTYACVARFAAATPLYNGQDTFAVKFQAISMLMNDEGDTEESRTTTILDFLSGVYVARILTDRVCPYDGFVTPNGVIHAASIARQLDHQLIHGVLRTMVPGFSPTHAATCEQRTWQVEVYEFVTGSTLQQLRAKPLCARTHNYWCALVAHVLCTVESFSEVRFTHGDLSVNNITLALLPSGLSGRISAAQYALPDGTTLYIPLAHTADRFVKLFDYTFSAADSERYGKPGFSDSNMTSTGSYNPAFDMHLLACQLIYGLLPILARPSDVASTDDLDSEAQYIQLEGITSATLEMLDEMLLPSNAIISSGHPRWNDRSVFFSEWDNAAGKCMDVTRSRMEIARVFSWSLAKLHSMLQTCIAHLKTYEATGRLTWDRNFSKRLSKYRSLTFNTGRWAHYCAVHRPENERRIAAFLASRHFQHYRAPILEGVVVMNQPV